MLTVCALTMMITSDTKFRRTQRRPLSHNERVRVGSIFHLACNPYEIPTILIDGNLYRGNTQQVSNKPHQCRALTASRDFLW